MITTSVIHWFYFAYVWNFDSFLLYLNEPWQNLIEFSFFFFWVFLVLVVLCILSFFFIGFQEKREIHTFNLSFVKNQKWKPALKIPQADRTI